MFLYAYNSITPLLPVHYISLDNVYSFFILSNVSSFLNGFLIPIHFVLNWYDDSHLDYLRALSKVAFALASQFHIPYTEDFKLTLSSSFDISECFLNWYIISAFAKH